MTHHEFDAFKVLLLNLSQSVTLKPNIYILTHIMCLTASLHDGGNDQKEHTDNKQI